MCLALPMRITQIDGVVGTCEVHGIERDVNLFMLQDAGLEPGDHVLVHVGYAIQKVSSDEARETLQLFEEANLG